MKNKKWLVFALVTTLSWGLWGALTGAYADPSIPSTMVYAIWAFTMIIPCLIVLKLANWRFETDQKSIALGCTIGFLGSGGQMLLFQVVTMGPSYIIFPIVSLSPIVTIGLSFLLLKERTRPLGAVGILLALIALPLFEFSGGSDEASSGFAWFAMTLCVMAAWGIQAYFMKVSNNHMSAEGIFVYMTITGLMLLPVAYLMTDFSQTINLSIETIAKTGAIQILNAIGALCLVFAFRYGKAIVVSPLTNAGAPLITTVLAIALIGDIPATSKIIGIVLAITAAVILSLEPQDTLQESVKK